MATADEPSRRPSVWVVDDSPLDVRLAQSALADWCSVQTFTDGSAVLEHLSANPPPDLLVLDWVMPGVTGIEVVAFLRSDQSRTSQVPVLLLTAQQNPEQIVEGLSAGANDYLAKPFAPSELRARAEALVRSQRLLERAVAAERAVRDLLTHAPDALLAIDNVGRVTYANVEAGRVFACQADALAGQKIGDLLPSLPLSSLRSLPGSSSPPLPDISLGDRIYAPTVRNPAALPEASAILALRDVTDRRSEDQRKLDFYSIIAHDLRSPLTAMMIRVDRLLAGKRGFLSTEATSDLRRFNDNIHSMVGLINGFLDLARLEEPTTSLELLEVDLAEEVASTIDELRPLTEVGGLALESKSVAHDCKVLGDKVRLGQVLSNLIGNAIKFTPPGGKISVDTKIFENVVRVSIADTGPGIPEDALESLFHRFTRLPSASRHTGSGLGLMIARQIVMAHGGDVGVTSEVGKGSTFWFTIPRVDVRPPHFPSRG